ncbi:type I-E CRISPR-associated protein Cas6/Cse3/CasE [Corynebacterium sp. TAE3-ERU30]|uniref:type I-E CRISPR-associated protein Cas6/Cse3/CasE n=1 Tax=Corynebacterium sp. TAE3-ERU30 TaxID=2849496 RepID=UPI001C46C230|nr:type I-E CRISPR-associated protein Cas6/Cse3/CasE [Corynebacterium sp. TAE3-ERU30]
MSHKDSIGVDLQYGLPSHLRYATRKDLHRIVMSGFADGQLDEAMPRSDARCLFAVSGNNLIVRHRPDLNHQIPGLSAERSALQATDPEQRYHLEVTVNALVARSQRGSLPPEVRQQHSPRGRRVPVPPDELPEWALDLLNRRNLEPDDLTVGERFNVRRTAGRTGIIPAVTITATVRGGAELDDVLSHGLGRGLNYGLGLVHVRPIH